MQVINSSEVRKEWSMIIDSVVRNRPAVIKRTRDYLVLSDINTISMLLEVYSFTAEKYIEDNGSVTLALNEMDLVENAENEDLAKKALADAIYDYAQDFYSEYEFWSSAPNRKAHIPYVFRALFSGGGKTLEDMIVCQDGQN